jgi:putative transposase
VNASVLDPPDPTDAVWVFPSQLLTVEVLRRPIESTQYLSVRYTQRLADEGAVTSVGSRGDSYDNALAEAVNALYKAELIGSRGPWRTASQVELATLEWVQWWNQRRLHGALDHIPPAEHEAHYYREHPQSKEVA